LAGIFAAANVPRIVAFGLAGNDTIIVSGALSQSATLFGDNGNDSLFGGRGSDQLAGGSGNDQLFGGAGADELCGDDGNDKLYGGPGRDLLIGGNGADQIFGGGGDDILVAGSTTFDEDPNSLQAIMAEWTSQNGYVTRVNNLRFGGGASGAVTLDSTTV